MDTKYWETSAGGSGCDEWPGSSSAELSSADDVTGGDITDDDVRAGLSSLAEVIGLTDSTVAGSCTMIGARESLERLSLGVRLTKVLKISILHHTEV